MYLLIKSCFLRDLSRITPWIKSIFNELDIISHVIASHLSGHCDVISNRLWRHQANVNRARETRGVKIVVFIVIYGFIMSCKKWNNVCTLVTNCLCTHSSVILVFIFLVAAQLRKWTPNITPSWPHHKKFATRVDLPTLFYIISVTGGFPSQKASDAALWCVSLLLALTSCWTNIRVAKLGSHDADNAGVSTVGRPSGDHHCD